MPAYNADKFIQEAIESVLEQTYRNFELIIIDDCSTDDTFKVAFSFKDPRIKIFQNKENKGVIFSLNKALNFAKGFYLARFDADDICLPSRIQTQIEFLIKKNVDIVGSYYMKFGNKSGIVKNPIHDQEIKTSLLFFNPIGHPTVLFKRALFDNGLFYYKDDWKHVEDYELWTRLIKNIRFYNVPKVLLKYRVSNGSICALFNNDQYLANIELKKNLFFRFFPNLKLDTIELNWLERPSMNFNSIQLEKIFHFIIKLTEENKINEIFQHQILVKLLVSRMYNSMIIKKSNRFELCRLYVLLHFKLRNFPNPIHLFWMLIKGTIK